ncbi:MAG: hypothetical protein A4E63_00898 [Syntrophorhabdus sp. PtaU1.Bin050]|jgi:hypothetical protein|nr:MAG: hypothetical protein A4E63_00898 [Syntrophorhabdus sp. PtaU1.Bin050]
MRTLSGVIFLVAALFCCGQAESRDWVNLISDNDYQYAYEKDSIVRPSKDIVNVWVRRECKDEAARQRVIVNRKEDAVLYKDYQGSKQLIEINCIKGTMDILSSTDYKINGDTLWSMTFSIRDPDPIPPGSRIDSVAKIVCKKD